MRICYFGIYDSTFSRNAIYIRGLKENGVEIIECQDRSRGLMKYVRLFAKHWKMRNSYDAMIVGYPGYIIAPFARLISRKLIVLDALCTFYEAQILSRDAYKGMPFRVAYTRFIDWLANTSSSLILVETNSQKEYYTKTLGVPEKKSVRIYTGVDDSLFYYDAAVQKHEKFTVLFRGRLMSEAGVKYILDAAKILENKGVNFEVIGFGWGKVVEDLKKQIEVLSLTNLSFTPKNLPITELRERMLRCHISLGQFEAHERLERTIPHKAFESLAMKLPYITAEAKAIKEILTDKKNVLFVKHASAEDLAEKILWAKEHPTELAMLARDGYELYVSKFTPKALGANIAAALKRFV